ncbi:MULTISPECIES: hypothetical protein [unclassified Streptomyces]|uniref:hypothetical protein n=1 Tax=unclassified Streptomyces TaxID=2593676 RepID=UPI00370222E6
MHVTRPVPVRALARLLPVLLYALCAFLVTPAPGTAVAQTAGPAQPAAVAERAPAHSAPGTHASAIEAAELPAVVEQSVRLSAPPVAPPAVRTADTAPVPGRVAGDPRRERAPPGLPYHPRTPRGPPSTRHS